MYEILILLTKKDILEKKILFHLIQLQNINILTNVHMKHS